MKQLIDTLSPALALAALEYSVAILSTRFIQLVVKFVSHLPHRHGSQLDQAYRDHA